MHSAADADRVISGSETERSTLDGDLAALSASSLSCFDQVTDTSKLAEVRMGSITAHWQHLYSPQFKATTRCTHQEQIVQQHYGVVRGSAESAIINPLEVVVTHTKGKGEV